MAVTTAERPLSAGRLAAMFGAHTEEAIRAMMRRAEHPLPCVVSGGPKRPHRKAYPAVYRAMLAYEQGVAPYDEVERAARHVPEGALQ